MIVVVLTLTHRYNAVRGHRTGSSNLYSSSVQYALNIRRLFLKHTLAVHRLDALPIRTFDFLERVVVPQAVGRLAVLIQ